MMRKLSRWGKHHPRTTRALIVISFLSLAGIGFMYGKIIAGNETFLPKTWLIILCSISVITAIAYPLKAKGQKVSAFQYNYRKTCDGILATTGFLLMIYMGNQPHEFFNYGSLRASVTTHTHPGDSAAKSYKSVWAFNKSMKDGDGQMLKWKEKRKLLKEQVRSIKKAKDLSQGGKVTLIILSVLVAAGLLALVLALSCELSCSGSGAAAVFVALAGVAIIAVLLVLVIRAILGKRKKKPKPADSTGT